MPGTRESFNFTEWSRLAAEDPVAFETHRRNAIDRMIRNFPESKQQRMRKLQWRIDQERDLSKTPMAACIRLSQMMWDAVLGEQGLLETIQGNRELLRGGAPKKAHSATVLNFPVRH
jgi:hypothetical protein